MMLVAARQGWGSCKARLECLVTEIGGAVGVLSHAGGMLSH